MEDFKGKDGLRQKFEALIEKKLLFLENQYPDIHWIFLYGSLARWNESENSDIDMFTVLDRECVYHDFLMDNDDGTQVTIEVLDKKSFYDNVCDNRLAQARILKDNSGWSLSTYQDEVKNGFFEEENIEKRVDQRKRKMQSLLSEYPDLDDISKVLSVLTFVKEYSLLVMDREKKIPSKKVEYQEVLSFLDDEIEKKQRNELVTLWFDDYEVYKKFKTVSSIILGIWKKILWNLLNKNTPFTSRIDDGYRDEFIRSANENKTLMPIITWIEIILTKYSVFHIKGHGLGANDFTLNSSSIKNLAKDDTISTDMNRLKSLIKGIDKESMQRFFWYMQNLLAKV